MAKINPIFWNNHNVWHKPEYPGKGRAPVEKTDESQGKRLVNIMTEAYKKELITKEELEKAITEINNLWGEQNEKPI